MHTVYTIGNETSYICLPTHHQFPSPMLGDETKYKLMGCMASDTTVLHIFVPECINW